MHEVGRQYKAGGALEVVLFAKTKVFGQDVEQIVAAFSDFAGQKLNVISRVSFIVPKHLLTVQSDLLPLYKKPAIFR